MIYTKEQLVISKALYKRDSEIFNQCTVDDFPSPEGKKCFEELSIAYDSGSDFNDDQFIERFKVQYSMLFPDGVQSQAEFYSENLIPTLKNGSMRLQVKSLSSELVAFCDDPAYPASLIREKLQRATEVSHITEYTGLETIKETAKNALDRLERIKDGTEKYLTFGMEGLERVKILKGDLVVLAARPRVGKTAIGLDMSRRSALSGQSTAFICLETDADQLYWRTLSQQSDVAFETIRDGLINATSGELSSVAYANTQLTSSPLHIISRYGQTVSNLRVLCRQLKNKGVEVIYIDYLQKIKCSGRRKRFEEMAMVSSGLKEIALEYNIAIVALTQLNRAVGTEKPRLDHLAQTSQIEQDASVVVLIDRPDVDNPIPPRKYQYGDQTITENDMQCRLALIVAKNRNGSTGTKLYDYDFSRYVIRGLSQFGKPRTSTGEYV